MHALVLYGIINLRGIIKEKRMLTMKINKAHFSIIENSNLRALLLKTLTDITCDKSPASFSILLNAILRECNDSRVAIYVFNYLTQVALDTGNIDFAFLLANTKASLFYLNPSLLSRYDIELYLEDVFELSKAFATFPQKDDSLEWSFSFKTFYSWAAFMLKSFSLDTLAFNKYRDFKGTFHVECLHCQNDLHSLYIDKDSTTITIDNIVSEWDGIFIDETFSYLYSVLDNMNEDNLIHQLPYVYGSYTCSVCNKTNSVINSILRYIQNNEEIFLPTQDYIDAVTEVYNFIPYTNYKKKWFVALYIFNLYNLHYGVGNLLSSLFITEAIISLQRYYPISFKYRVYQRIESYLENYKECLELAKLYSQLAKLISFCSSPHLKYKYSIQELYGMSYNSYKKFLGENHQFTIQTLFGLNFWNAYAKKVHINSIVNEYTALKQFHEISKADMVIYMHWMVEYFDVIKNTACAITEMKELIEFVISNSLSDLYPLHFYYTELGYLYDFNHNFKQAIKFYNKAIKAYHINPVINFINNLYFYHSVFRKPLDILFSITRINYPNTTIISNAHYIRSILLLSTNLYIANKQYNLALEKLSKVLCLTDWLYENDILELSYVYITVAKVYLGLGNDKKAIEYFNLAISIFDSHILDKSFGEYSEAELEVVELVITIGKLILAINNNLTNFNFELYEKYKIG